VRTARPTSRWGPSRLRSRVAKAIAARVMSVARGGQILLTAHARQSLSAEGLRLQSHGHWRLKGLDEPIELFGSRRRQGPFTPTRR
jgi:class 3 adenylate cyclase